MDIYSKDKRSQIMSRIRSKNTKPELLLFGLLKNAGLKYKKHYKITGKPDAAFPKQKLAIFVDGEYWHGKDFGLWKNRLTKFWIDKIRANILRDRKNRKKPQRPGMDCCQILGKIPYQISGKIRCQDNKDP